MLTGGTIKVNWILNYQSVSKSITFSSISISVHLHRIPHKTPRLDIHAISIQDECNKKNYEINHSVRLFVCLFVFSCSFNVARFRLFFRLFDWQRGKQKRRVQLHGNPWYCDACVIGPLLKWLDASPSTRHIKEGCRGLRSNAANATDAADAPCPVCHSPSSVAGVELPRLDHVNLPSSCNYPPTLIDSGDLPSKVQASPASDQAPFQLFSNPVYASLMCGSLTLIMVAICAALAVVTRHAASYYTHEDKRGGAAASQGVVGVGAEDPLCSDHHNTKKKNKKNKKKNMIVSSTNCSSNSSSSSSSSSSSDQHKNNNGKIKASPTSSPVRVHRGVHCNTSNGHLTSVAVYPMTSFDSHPTDQRPLCWYSISYPSS